MFLKNQEPFIVVVGDEHFLLLPTHDIRFGREHHALLFSCELRREPQFEDEFLKSNNFALCLIMFCLSHFRSNDWVMFHSFVTSYKT